MKYRKEITDLVSLLKVFDINFVNSQDCNQLSGLDVNSDVDVQRVINNLLMPEFANYLPESQKKILEGLHSYLSDEAENFSRLFDRIELAFDGALIDHRHFMSMIFNELNSMSD